MLLAPERHLELVLAQQGYCLLVLAQLQGQRLGLKEVEAEDKVSRRLRDGGTARPGLLARSDLVAHFAVLVDPQVQDTTVAQFSSPGPDQWADPFKRRFTQSDPGSQAHDDGEHAERLHEGSPGFAHVESVRGDYTASPCILHFIRTPQTDWRESLTACVGVV